MRRPYTMAEVVERTNAGLPWDIAFPEFLDTFYFALRGWPGPHPQSCLDAEPPAIDDSIWHAQLGAVGEHLALRWNLATPAWTRHPSRFLHEPYFPSGTQTYKGWYFVQSPTAFRRRMIFTEAEPLRRARLPHPAFYARDVARGYTWLDGTVRAVFGDSSPESYDWKQRERVTDQSGAAHVRGAGRPHVGAVLDEPNSRAADVILRHT